MKKNSFIVISLGCAKNTVDSYSIARLLANENYQQVENPDEAEYIIVNTCGFIHDAREESREIITQLAENKENEQKIIATGCFTERLGNNFFQEIAGVDAILGTRNWHEILPLIKQNQKSRILPENQLIRMDYADIPRFAVQGSTAYLKIADGCDHRCAFCAIPLIKGNQVSRTIERIRDDVKKLNETGIQELILVAQDTSAYGSDMGLKDGLPYLFEQILPFMENIPWLRTLYAFPNRISDQLITTIKENQQVLPYLDIPIQHGDNEMLKRMQRPANIDHFRKRIEQLRTAVPNICLRTTVIVGFPGETDSSFQNLLDFIEEVEFDHLGAFTYSPETGTSAEKLGDPVPEADKLYMYEEVMKIQEQISLKHNQKLIGKEMEILIEGSNDDISIGRTYRDAPEIDGMVILYDNIPPGSMITGRITDAMPHDLVAEIVNDEKS